jgi:predicted AlkP superfamily phosphohydrolase/phosphomutase
MKLLVIGMDGVQESTFSRGNTPYIHNLIRGGDIVRPSEDLISRGWAEIALGKHGSYTGATYEGPACDGTLSWSESFKLSDVTNLGSDAVPIWSVINEMGYKVGVVNLPTSFPAPEVDGFFISGGGGGGPILQEVVEDQCFPLEIHKNLVDSGYIVDERLPTLLAEKKLYAEPDFFQRLDLMNSRRVHSFIKLSKAYDVDFGFLVFKSSPVICETLLPPELEKLNNKSLGVANTSFIENGGKFMSDLDKHVRRVIDSFPGARVILVSDHSQVLRRYSVNLNIFLEKEGYMELSKSGRGIFRVAQQLKGFMPLALKNKLKNVKKIRAKYESLIPFDPKKTSAFMMALSNGSHGIYVNDSKFGGPVNDQDKEAVIKNILKALESDEDLTRHGITAYASRTKYAHPINPRFPDIVVHLPDGYQTSATAATLIQEERIDPMPFDLNELNKASRITSKGHTPLAVMVNGSWSNVSKSDDVNLCFIYDEIISFFKNLGGK